MKKSSVFSLALVVALFASLLGSVSAPQTVHATPASGGSPGTLEPRAVLSSRVPRVVDRGGEKEGVMHRRAHLCWQDVWILLALLLLAASAAWFVLGE